MTGGSFVNLVPESVLCGRAVRRRVRWWCVWGGLGLPVVAACAGLWAAMSLEPTGELRGMLEAEGARAAELEGEIARLGVVIEGRASKLALRRRITETPRWSPLFVMLADRLGDRVALESLALMREVESVRRGGAVVEGAAEHRVFLSGRTDSTQTLSEVLLTLEREPLFSAVDLVSSRSREGAGAEGGLIGFEIECVVGGGGAGGARVLVGVDADGGVR